MVVNSLKSLLILFFQKLYCFLVFILIPCIGIVFLYCVIQQWISVVLPLETCHLLVITRHLHVIT